MNRFTRWLRGDPDQEAKEQLLAEIGGSAADDEVALERVNVDRRALGRQPITEATVRTWTRDDPEFAQALGTARQHRDEYRRHPPQPLGDPAGWVLRGRLDTRPDPYRVAYSVDDLIGPQI